MWIVEKYIKYLIGFAILWGGLFWYRSCACAKVIGSSMNPTFLSDEFLRVDLTKRRPVPGEIASKDTVWFEYHRENVRESGYLGRVIALPMDKVALKDGDVHVNGLPLAEEYLKAEFKQIQTIPEIVVPRNHYYILCDNRREGNPPDSRTFGPVSVHAVMGRVKR